MFQADGTLISAQWVISREIVFTHTMKKKLNSKSPSPRRRKLITSAVRRCSASAQRGQNDSESALYVKTGGKDGATLSREEKRKRKGKKRRARHVREFRCVRETFEETTRAALCFPFEGSRINPNLRPKLQRIFLYAVNILTRNIPRITSFYISVVLFFFPPTQR